MMRNENACYTVGQFLYKTIILFATRFDEFFFEVTNKDYIKWEGLSK